MNAATSEMGRARVAAHSAVMRSPHPRLPAVAALGVVLALAAGCSAASSSPTATNPSAALAATARVVGAPSGDPAPGVPALGVDTLVDGLEHPWDIGFLPNGVGLDGAVLVPERVGRLQLVRGGTASKVSMDLSDVFAQGESGLMGLLVHPDFATTHEFSTCQSHTENGAPVDIRVKTWTLSPNGDSATAVAAPLVSGLPLNPSGRHSGCRLGLNPTGALMISTGDTANPAAPQNLTNLGGKTLRADLHTGAPLPGAPFPQSPYVYSFGHRNLQGIVTRPGTHQVFTAEHGPDIDDEVNLDQAGGNYGWDPSQGGTVTSYDESVPMTDTTRFPDAVPAVWSSGDPTQAISGATFVTGPQWGALDGALLVVALKGQKMIGITLDADGGRTGVLVPPALNGTHGRLRSVGQGPDGALYVTTDNGTNDALLKVTPTR